MIEALNIVHILLCMSRKEVLTNKDEYCMEGKYQVLNKANLASISWQRVEWGAGKAVQDRDRNI